MRRKGQMIWFSKVIAKRVLRCLDSTRTHRRTQGKQGCKVRSTPIIIINRKLPDELEVFCWGGQRGLTVASLSIGASAPLVARQSKDCRASPPASKGKFFPLPSLCSISVVTTTNKNTDARSVFLLGRPTGIEPVTPGPQPDVITISPWPP